MVCILSIWLLLKITWCMAKAASTSTVTVSLSRPMLHIVELKCFWKVSSGCPRLCQTEWNSCAVLCLTTISTCKQVEISTASAVSTLDFVKHIIQSQIAIFPVSGPHCTETNSVHAQRHQLDNRSDEVDVSSVKICMILQSNWCECNVSCGLAFGKQKSDLCSRLLPKHHFSAEPYIISQYLTYYIYKYLKRRNKILTIRWRWRLLKMIDIDHAAKWQEPQHKVSPLLWIYVYIVYRVYIYQMCT